MNVSFGVLLSCAALGVGFVSGRSTAPAVDPASILETYQSLEALDRGPAATTECADLLSRDEMQLLLNSRDPVCGEWVEKYHSRHGMSV